MELADIRDWIKTLGVGDYFYIGKLENKRERSIGIYQRQPSGVSKSSSTKEYPLARLIVL